MRRCPILLVVYMLTLIVGRGFPIQGSNVIRIQGLVLRPNLIIGNSKVGAESFEYPVAVAVNSDGEVFIADYLKRRVSVFSKDGRLVRTIGSKKPGGPNFSGPRAICVDPSGQIFVADTKRTGATTIIVLSPDGARLRSFSVPMAPQKMMVRHGSLFLSHRMTNFDFNLYEFSLEGTRIGEYENVSGLEEDKAATTAVVDQSGSIVSAGYFAPFIKKYSREGKLVASGTFEPKIANKMSPLQLTSSYQAGRLRIEGSEHPIVLDIAVDRSGHIFLLVARDHKEEERTGLLRLDSSLRIMDDVDLPFFCSRIYIDEEDSFYFLSRRRTKCLVRCRAEYLE